MVQLSEKIKKGQPFHLVFQQQRKRDIEELKASNNQINQLNRYGIAIVFAGVTIILAVIYILAFSHKSSQSQIYCSVSNSEGCRKYREGLYSFKNNQSQQSQNLLDGLVAPKVKLDDQVRYLLEKYSSPDNYIILATSNYYYVEQGFMNNFIKRMEKLNISSYILGAYDEKTYKYFQDLQIPSVLLANDLPSTSMSLISDFGNFQKQGLKSLELTKLVISLGYHVIHTELDVVWFENPIDFMRNNQDVDIMFQTDRLNTTVDDAGFEAESSESINLGMLFLRNTCQKLVEKWYALLKNATEKSKADNANPLTDEQVLQQLARDSSIDKLPNRTFSMFGKAIGTPLKAAFLNVALFTGGHAYFVQRMAQKLQLQPLALHPTLVYAQHIGKKHRLREEQIWVDEDAYYTPQNTEGFISFDINVGQDMVYNAVPNQANKGLYYFVPHFQLIHHQMKQVKIALALGLIFNRTVIMDQIWSAFDQIQYDREGRPMNQFTGPFKAPLDHTMNIEAMYDRKLDFNKFGPYIEFREHNFLRNERVRDVNNSRVNIYRKGQTGPDQLEDQNFIQHLELQAPISENQFKNIMKEHRGKQLWHFKSLQGDVLTKFDMTEIQEQFTRRMSYYSGLFCCAEGTQLPKYAYYDMNFDIPHTDRFGRNFTKKWELLNGKMHKQEIVREAKAKNATHEIKYLLEKGDNF